MQAPSPTHVPTPAGAAVSVVLGGAALAAGLLAAVLAAVGDSMSAWLLGAMAAVMAVAALTASTWRGSPLA